MDPLKRPVVTQQDVDTAQRDRAKATLTALGFTGGITAVNYLFNAPGPKSVQKLAKIVITGVDAKPHPSGRASVSVPKVTILAAVLPQPVGYIPAEAYGLHPEIYKQLLSVPVGSKPPFFSATDARLKVFEARAAAAAIGAKATGNPLFENAPSNLGPQQLLPGRILVTTEELDFLKALPPGFSDAQKLIPQLEAQRQNFFAANPVSQSFVPVPGFTGSGTLPAINPFGAEVLPGSLQTELFHPVNDKGIADEAAAEGIRRSLISERVDP